MTDPAAAQLDWRRRRQDANDLQHGQSGLAVEPNQVRAEFLSLAGDYRQVRFNSRSGEREWQRRRGPRLALRARLSELRDLDFRKRLRQSRSDRFAVIECPAGNDAGMSIRPQRLWIDCFDNAVFANLRLQQAEQFHTC